MKLYLRLSSNQASGFRPFHLFFCFTTMNLRFTSFHKSLFVACISTTAILLALGCITHSRNYNAVYGVDWKEFHTFTVNDPQLAEETQLYPAQNQELYVNPTKSRIAKEMAAHGYLPALDGNKADLIVTPVWWVVAKMDTTNIWYSEDDNVNPTVVKQSTLEITVERSSDMHVIWRGWLRIPIEENDWNTTNINQAIKETLYFLPQAGTAMIHTQEEHDAFFN
jgi:hypothetical protein